MRDNSDKTIVILTGAGISAESGLATFRDNNGQKNSGLWCNHRVEDVATPEAFERDPKLVQEFYNLRRAQLKKAKPNAAHMALAELAENWNGRVFLITQNVDDLHDRAADMIVKNRGQENAPALSPSHRGGQKTAAGDNYKKGQETAPALSDAACESQKARSGGDYIFHMHGELRKARCAVSEEIFNWDDNILVETPCPCCSKPGRLRPHIVWFGEMPLYMDLIQHVLSECDLFMSIGTSGNVYPAAGFVQQVRMRGIGHAVEINMEPSSGHSLFHEKIYGPATQTVPAYVKKILSGNII